jgi:hypothetical protein
LPSTIAAQSAAVETRKSREIVKGQTVRVLSIIFGIILLLPGVCSIVFTSMITGGQDYILDMVWASGLLLGGFGLWLIFKGGKRS